MTRVLVVGHVTHDRYGDVTVPGGCAYYGAQVYRALGADVHLATVVGKDFACEEVLQAQPHSVRRSGKTTVFTNLYPAGHPRVQVVEAVAPPVLVTDLPPELLQADLVHLAPVFREVDLASWRAASRAGIFALGVQGWIKKRAAPLSLSEIESGGLTASACRVEQQPWTINAASLRGIDVACLSAEDLLEQGDLLDRLCDVVPIVALTQGQAGCDIIVRGTTTRVGSYATKVVDSTGAGDTFAAAFLYRLACGDDPVGAARMGAAAASIIVEERAGAALSRLSETTDRVQQIATIID